MINKASPTERLHAVIHHMEIVCEELRAAIDQAIALRHQAASLEGPAAEIKNNSRSTETERAEADKMTAQAEELRKEAHNSRVAYFKLFGHLRELKQDLDLCLLEFGEKGKELREVVNKIGFSSWSAEPGWPLASDDEGGMVRGSATLDKILATVLNMFPIPGGGELVPSDGANPWSPLLLDSSGSLYGTTLLGGTYGCGTVFKYTP